MGITLKSSSKNIKFRVRSGGSFKYKESQRVIHIKADTLKALINFISKMSSLTLKVLAKVRSKFSS